MNTLAAYNITYNDLTNYLGQPNKIRYHENYFQCPICASYGADTSKNNLIYNNSKDIITCFANSDHSKEIISDILKNKNKSHQKEYKQPLKPILNANKKENEFVLDKELNARCIEYIAKCQDELLNDKKALDYIFKKRGLNKTTVELTGIGIDKKQRIWVFPTYQYMLHPYILPCVGAEFRPSDLSKNIKRMPTVDKGGLAHKNITHIAMINLYTPKTTTLLITEGYIDGYTFFQYFYDLGLSNKYHIITPTNGINTLFNNVNRIDFSKYKNFILFIDNDKPSIEAANKILDNYPFFENRRITCSGCNKNDCNIRNTDKKCKDFNDYYRNCILKTKDL